MKDRPIEPSIRTKAIDISELRPTEREQHFVVDTDFGVKVEGGAAHIAQETEMAFVRVIPPTLVCDWLHKAGLSNSAKPNVLTVDNAEDVPRIRCLLPADPTNLEAFQDCLKGVADNELAAIATDCGYMMKLVERLYNFYRALGYECTLTLKERMGPEMELAAAARKDVN